MTTFPPEVIVANKTARGGGAVGAEAVVPGFVKRYVLPGQTVLDFGAGPEARHTIAMRGMGLQVTAYDFGANVTPGLHDPRALERQYDVVLASNVLNVADTEALLLKTLNQIACAVRQPKGIALVNLPKNPRKGAWLGTSADEARLMRLLMQRFETVQQLPRFYACRRAKVRNAPHG